MRRLLTVACTLLFAGIALAGCAGNDTTNGGGGGAASQAVVEASPLAPEVGEPVAFRAAQAAAGDTATWQFGDGAEGNGTDTTHTYSAPGQYIVLLTLKSGDRETTNDASLTYITVSQADLELANVTNETAPIATAASSAQVVAPGTEIRFTANGSGAWEPNPDFDISNPIQGPGSGNEPFLVSGEVEATWEFGDGATAEGMDVTHAFGETGLYPVKLTVTDAKGQSSNYYLTVRALPEPPEGGQVTNPKTYIHATIGEPESLDPGYDYETAGGTVLQHVYETLVTYQRDSAERLRPLLASEMPQVSANGTEYTFKLRTGVTFHNGDTLDAEDVKFSLDRLILMNDAHGPAWIYGVIKGADDYFASDMTAADRQAYLDAGGITVVDPQTVKFTLSYTDPAFLYRLAFQAASIVSMQGVCANSPGDFVDCLPPPGESRHPWMDEHEVGSGPFQLEAWVPSQQVILTKYDGYWGEKPALDKVILQKVDDINTRLLMLFSGQADSVYVPVDHDRDVLGREDQGIVVRENPSWTVSFLGLNQKFCGGEEDPKFNSCMQANAAYVPKGADGQPDPYFFQDINMRKAWALAFSYDTYYNDILNQHGRMLNGPLPQGIFGYDASIPQPQQDVEAAKEFLAQTNHSDGFTITVAYNSGNTVREKTANLLKQNIEALAPGKITVNVEGLDWSTAFLPKTREKAVPVFYLGWAPDYAYPDNYVVTFAHSQKGDYSKRVGYANPELDAKLDELLQTTDEQAARQGWSGAVQMLNEDYAFLWLGQASNFHVSHDYVNGYYYNPMHSGGPGIGDYTTISKG